MALSVVIRALGYGVWLFGTFVLPSCGRSGVRLECD